MTVVELQISSKTHSHFGCLLARLLSIFQCFFFFFCALVWKQVKHWTCLWVFVGFLTQSLKPFWLAVFELELWGKLKYKTEWLFMCWFSFFHVCQTIFVLNAGRGASHNKQVHKHTVIAAASHSCRYLRRQAGFLLVPDQMSPDWLWCLQNALPLYLLLMLAHESLICWAQARLQTVGNRAGKEMGEEAATWLLFGEIWCESPLANNNWEEAKSWDTVSLGGPKRDKNTNARFVMWEREKKARQAVGLLTKSPSNPPRRYRPSCAGR